MRALGTMFAATMGLLCLLFIALCALSVAVALNIETGEARYWILAVQNVGMAAGTGFWATVAWMIRP